MSKHKNLKEQKKNILKIESCQAFSTLRDIKDGIVITKDRRFIKILEISPINFLLRSPKEQAAIIQSFAMVLKIMPAKAQFKIISRRADVSGFINKIRNNYRY